MRAALFQPDQPGNVGAVLRIGACFGVSVDIIEPCGFAFSDRALKRAAMDYREQADFVRHPDWDRFERQVTGRIVLMTTRADILLPDARFERNDIILLGAESRGVPDGVHDRADLRIRIPQMPGSRSLNIAVAAGIAVAEALEANGELAGMIELDYEQREARAWFESLRDRICGEFEAIEAEAGSTARFQYAPWERHDDSGTQGGGGVRGLMKGAVFEKVGVNVSTVGGRFSPEFARTIHGADEDPRFVATGISLVAHMANPHVPAVHLNTRFLCTRKRWFGGGADLNPPIPYEVDTAEFHHAFEAACERHDPSYYERFRKWADDYFYIPHRGVHRGVGGIFYDHLEGNFQKLFAFTRDVGETFLTVFPMLVRRRMGTEFTEADKARQLEYRGRYAEFNLLYDRGTMFGLKTGGNIDAILMSLPPVATWT